MTYKCKGPRVGKSSERKGCGADLTGLIEDVPVDGEVHKVKCPKCENTATVRRVPVAALED